MALGAAFGIAAPVVTALPASAEDGVFMKNLLGDLGVIDKDRDPIDYRERAPLAVPPKLDLPQPTAPAAARAAAWPTDPDVVKRKQAIADKRKPVPFPNDNQPSQGARLSRDELNRTTRITSKTESGPRKVYGDGRLSTWIDPDELKKTATNGDPSNMAYGEEPDRDSLLAPPTGYRMPASNAPLKPTKDPIILKSDRPEKDFQPE